MRLALAAEVEEAKASATTHDICTRTEESTISPPRCPRWEMEKLGYGDEELSSKAAAEATTKDVSTLEAAAGADPGSS